MSMVRDALVTSVTCTAEPELAPPVRFQMIQLSMVPASARPLLTASATAGTFSSSHLILVALK
jgi:hypothetical protein